MSLRVNHMSSVIIRSVWISEYDFCVTKCARTLFTDVAGQRTHSSAASNHLSLYCKTVSQLYEMNEIVKYNRLALIVPIGISDVNYPIRQLCNVSRRIVCRMNTMNYSGEFLLKYTSRIHRWLLTWSQMYWGIAFSCETVHVLDGERVHHWLHWQFGWCSSTQ